MDPAVTAIPVRPRPGRRGVGLVVTGAKAKGGVAPSPCMWRLPHRAESVGTARRIVDLVLHECCEVDDDTLSSAELVVSELVTNAIEHARPPVVLYVEAASSVACGACSVHIEVTDGGPAAQDGEWTSSCTDDEHGRGSGIVDVLTSNHGTHPFGHGVTHWADMPPGAEQAP
ncbi:ATP-binding protein [Streptomyces sp. NPDC126514]|uniref:ATP-binding protein n=1 Tax=Streptomyces sp. NPDC126514 TaxID=3155210 RepID=UPI003320D12B